MYIQGINVHGAIDQETRCKHYQGETDRIAIQFYCCGEFYPCYQCHAEHGCGAPKVWPKEQYSSEAILCGGCDATLSIKDYLECENTCPSCSAAFNPGCVLHRHLYFDVS